MLREFKDLLNKHIQRQRNHPHLPKNFSLPSSLYISKERHEKEREVLKILPNAIGPLDELDQIRDYLKSGEGSELKLFHNACPHRGARLKREENGFTCSYHGWSFDEKGVLKKATGHVCPYRPGALKLMEVKSKILGGMVFSGESIDEALMKEIDTFSTNHSFIDQRAQLIKCNWKFLVESLLETYHFPFAHHSILKDFENAYFSLNSWEGQNCRILIPLTDLEAGLEEENLKGINVMYYLFPYSFVLFMGSGFVWFQIEPLEVGLCRLKRFLFSEEDKKEMALNSFKILDKILQEDFEILEGQQENTIHCDRYFLTGYEDTIRSFHDRLNRCV